MNAIDLLKEQHRAVLSQLEGLSEENGKGKRDRMSMMKKVANDLAAHMVIEETIFYPRAAEALGDPDLVAEAFEEHAVAHLSLKRVMSAMEDEDFAAKVRVLRELIRHHVEEEENELMPKLSEAIPGEELEQLGAEMSKKFESQRKAGFEKAKTATRAAVRKVMSRAMHA